MNAGSERKGRQSRLFRSDQSCGNVVLNFLHRPQEEFSVYAAAFWRAGKALAEQMAASAGYNRVVVKLVFSNF